VAELGIADQVVETNADAVAGARAGGDTWHAGHVISSVPWFAFPELFDEAFADPHFVASVPLVDAAPDERSQAGKELAERERLDQVVIGAGVETSDPVFDSVTRREEEDRGPALARPQLATDREPIHAREHDVEDDRVVVVFERSGECLVPVVALIDGMAFLLKPSPDGASHLDLVFDQQDMHPHRLQRPVSWRSMRVG